MTPTSFEPFGESVDLPEAAPAQSRGARRLTAVGSSIFWLLAITIVVARAVYFQPGLFDSFEKVVAFLH
jgi:hypothetical protein